MIKIGDEKLVRALRILAALGSCTAAEFSAVMWTNAAGWAARSKTGPIGARMHSAGGGLLGRLRREGLVRQQGARWEITEHGIAVLRNGARLQPIPVASPAPTSARFSAPQQHHQGPPAQAHTNVVYEYGRPPPGPCLNQAGYNSPPPLTPGRAWQGWYWDGRASHFWDGCRGWYWDQVKWQPWSN